MTDFRTIAVIGLGYIGLPTAAILATNGLDVIGVDVNQRTVDAVNEGRVPFVEPDLGIHVAGAVSQGRLKATTETPAADAFIVAVPTPFTADKSADLSYIEAAARGIAPVLQLSAVLSGILCLVLRQPALAVLPLALFALMAVMAVSQLVSMRWLPGNRSPEGPLAQQGAARAGTRTVRTGGEGQCPRGGRPVLPRRSAQSPLPTAAPDCRTRSRPARGRCDR